MTDWIIDGYEEIEEQLEYELIAQSKAFKQIVDFETKLHYDSIQIEIGEPIKKMDVTIEEVVPSIIVERKKLKKFNQSLF